MFPAALRGVALFLGLFAIVNVVGDLRFARANTNIWWLDLWPLPLVAARVVLLAISAVLLLYACRKRLAWPGRAFLLMTAAVALLNVVRFYIALIKGEIRTPLPLPLSAVIAVVLILIARTDDAGGDSRRMVVAASAVMTALVFPVLQVCFFGVTDYRRPADVIVVFGARAYANGTPSEALADRVMTACDLYRAGLAPRILMSGGPGEGQTSEPRVMRAFAERHGVPSSAIIEDDAGLNTEATVMNTLRLVPERPTRALVVSHFYHLPRIKMAYEHYGVNAFTVPSRNTVPFSMPFNIAREDVAFWWYYARHLA